MKNIYKYIYIFLFLIQVKVVNAQNISGNISDLNFNAPVSGAIITLQSKLDNSIIGKDTTDNNGNYNIDYIIVGIKDENNYPVNYYLSEAYPNPFNPSTRINFSSHLNGNYNISIFNLLGEKLFNKTYNLLNGSYTFDISGLGAAGIYFFNIWGKAFSETKKMMLLDGGSNNISVKLLNGNSNINKIKTSELLFKVEKEGYAAFDTKINNFTSYLNIKINQNWKNKNITFSTHQNLIPTNTPADSSVISSEDLFEGITDTNGNFTANFSIQYIQNPSNANDKKWKTETIIINAERKNTASVNKSFTNSGENINWENNLQQNLIYETAVANGNVKDDLSQPLENAGVKIFNADSNKLLAEVYTNQNGDYVANWSHPFYENDANNDFSPEKNIGFDFAAPSHKGYNATVAFADSISMDAVLDRIQTSLSYEGYIQLRKTLEGRKVTDLPSLNVTWPDGTSGTLTPDANGLIHFDKTFSSVNSDTTASLTHNYPDRYLKWMVGTTTNPNKVEWLFQNATYADKGVIYQSTNDVHMPLNVFNSRDTIEVYLVPKYAEYIDGIMTMDSKTVTDLWATSTWSATAAHRQAGDYPTTEVILFHKNFSDGQTIPDDELDKARTEWDTYLDAMQWQNKKLMKYHRMEAEDFNDPNLTVQSILHSPRNRDNITYTYFHNAITGNYRNIKFDDGSYRMFYSFSSVPTGTPPAVVFAEIFSSMTNTTGDITPYLVKDKSATSMSDLGKNLIGINYLFHNATQYNK